MAYVHGEQCEMCGGQAEEFHTYFCRVCHLKFDGIAPGEKCDLCGRRSELVDGWKMKVDRSEERLLYSAILTEAEQLTYFPDYPYPVKICGNCAAHADDYGYLDKDDDSTPVLAYEGKSILSNFSDRSAMSSLGVLIVRDVLEASGYQIKTSGFEETHSHLKSLNRSPDPSESLVRIRSNPDLEVTDNDTATVFRVEVKVTTQPPDFYLLESGVVHNLRNYHNDAVLLIYHIPSSRMHVQKIRNIDWDSLPFIEKNGSHFYHLQFASYDIFQDLPDLFDKVTKETMDERLRIMCELFRRNFVGLELSSHFTSNSF